MIDREVLKARVRKYAPIVITTASVVATVAVVVYYRNKLKWYEDALFGKQHKWFDDPALRLPVTPDQWREVVKEGAIMQYWISPDGAENLITTTVFPEEYKNGGELTMVEVDHMQSKPPKKSKENV